MTMSKLGRAAGDMLISLATRGGSQNFLGARWVEWTGLQRAGDRP
jgi:hypothetical protein